MKILFVMSHVPNPRMIKRIELLEKKFDVEVIYVERHNSDMYTFDKKNITSYSLKLNLPTSKQVLRRIIASIKYFFFILKKTRNKNYKIIYIEGLDTLILTQLCFFYKKVHCIFEVADLREIYLKNTIKNKIINKIAEFFYKKINILVLTSEKFYSEYFYKYIAKNKIVVIPNIPEKKIFEGFKKKENEKFTVGFIGGIRYLNQIKMLIDVSEELDINILLAGAGGTKEEYQEIQSYCQNKENVIITGKYDYQKEIKSLYEMVDCVYSVYDNTNLNVRIALPNKLYESIYCELPIIVAKNTYLEEIVNALGVGKAIENRKELKILLENWKNKNKDYLEMIENCKKNKKIINIEEYNNNLIAKIKNNERRNFKNFE